MSRILPILFNQDMVRAILDGRKTVTRRLIKPQPHGDFGVNGIPCYLYSVGFDKGCIDPKYQVGDIIYVRETWSVEGVYGNSGVFGFDVVCKAGEQVLPVIIKDFKRYCDIGKFFDKEGWIPSLFMPKEAARIWIKITDVRAERLQDITEEQAKAEGFIDNRGMIHSPDNEYDRIHSAREHFIDTFLNLYPDCSLDTWVWVYEFERCEKLEEVTARIKEV